MLFKILKILFLKTLFKIKRIRIIFNHFELFRNFALMQAIEHDNWVNMLYSGRHDFQLGILRSYWLNRPKPSSAHAYFAKLFFLVMLLFWCMTTKKTDINSLVTF